MLSGLALFGTFLVLLVLGAPIAVALGSAAILSIWQFELGMPGISYTFFAGIAKFPLLAIPFFIFAGVVMEKAGIARRIFRFVRLLMRGMPGGLAVATVILALFWGAVSGSGPATVAALGLILIPGMVQQGYGRAFATGLVSATSELAIIIPPSIAFIVYASITNVSVAAIFAAGIVPGIIVGCAMGTVALFISIRRGYRGVPEPGAGLRELGSSFLEAFWGLLTPVIILGGIYSGVFTPTEAAAVAIFWGLFVGVAIYREFRFKELWSTLIEASVSTSVIMIVVSLAGLFSWAAHGVGVVDMVSTAILGITSHPILLLLVINAFLLILGTMLDAISIYFIFLPIFMPIMATMGWDPVWFGVVMTVNLAIGQITPPVAVNLYVGAYIGKVTLEALWAEVWKFAVAAVVALLIIAYIPALTLWLPRLFGLMP